MKRAFLDAYNKELALLYERSGEFAREYPGIAERLGGMVKENLDPAVAGLLEGTAFLAARVQHKMDEEFRTFTAELLEQIFPDALQPIPSAMLVRANPPLANKDLVRGLHFPAGAYMDARFVDADQRVACRFRLAEPLSVWPLTIPAAEYHDSPAPFLAAGEHEVMPGTRGGLQISLLRPRATASTEAAGPLSDLDLDVLPVYLSGMLADAALLYEQIFCDLKRLSLRYLDANGDPVFVRLDPRSIEQLGFDDGVFLYPRKTRLFDGMARLREAFAFPRKLLGFRLVGLGPVLKRIKAGEAQILMEFGRVDRRLAGRLGPDQFSLNTAPAVNLFEEHSSQVRLDRKRQEFAVTPDSSPLTHYEIIQIETVQAHYTGGQGKVEVHPLYGLPEGQPNPRAALYYTMRRKPRRLTEKERRFGASYRYRGTETFISIFEPPDTPEDQCAQRLQITALCSNRHLPEHLPIAQSTDDFTMRDDVSVSLACISGPTPPRDSLVQQEKGASHRMTAGENSWRLISYLSLSQFAIDGSTGRDAAASLREVLSLFVDVSDTVTER
ncbi:MAG: type VI secretion system baseplate subunit TssF, partial [Rubellimicrobium sp.]|nr:type VI secretion system baseplate subunit TssF [Rubellimicrobium sp.]